MTTRTAKTLVVCIDGTWNAPGQRDWNPATRVSVETRTNVARTWEMLTGQNLDADRAYGRVAPLARQPGVALYLSGVGSVGNVLKQYVQGATGCGIAERVCDAYRFLTEHWRPGDRIYGFGFSRGAFAVRSLMGFIDAVGLPAGGTGMDKRDVTRLHAAYRRRGTRPVVRLPGMTDAPIQFLGLWDTVGALAFGGWFNGYHDISPRNVRHVCHAVAMDEERSMFWPEMWADRRDAQQIVEEVLFAGAHTNVGGGYSDERLSTIPLSWILERAQQSGLQSAMIRTNTDGDTTVFATRRPSYAEAWHTCPGIGRLAIKYGLARAPRQVRRGQQLHPSVRQALLSGTYRPSVHGAESLCAA